MHRIIKNILILISSIGLLTTFILLAILWAFSSNLPDYKFLKNYKPSVSSKVYSGEGELVNDFSTKKRIFVPYKAIPEKIINSFLSAEDKNFFSHPGVDAKGVVRAVINNISNIISSRRLEGASTITQQVAKNFLLTNEVSLNRKFKESPAMKLGTAVHQAILEPYDFHDNYHVAGKIDKRTKAGKASYENAINDLAVAEFKKQARVDPETVKTFRSALGGGVMNTILMGTPADKPIIEAGIAYIPMRVAKQFGMKEDSQFKGYARIESALLGLPFQFFSYAFAALNIFN
jgi:hypothetical protein